MPNAPAQYQPHIRTLAHDLRDAVDERHREEQRSHPDIGEYDGLEASQERFELTRQRHECELKVLPAEGRDRHDLARIDTVLGNPPADRLTVTDDTAGDCEEQ